MRVKDLSSGRRVRVGLLGAGGIAPEHADALRLLGDIDLAAVCDLQTARAKALAADWGIGAVYSSLAEMLAAEKLDVVHVLTQPQHHVEPALQCLRAGCHVYVEKPLGLTTADCRRVVDAAAETGLSVGVNQQAVWHPCLTAIGDLLRERRLGRLNHVWLCFTVNPVTLPVSDVNHFMFAAPGNLIYEFAPHPFSMVRRLVGKANVLTSVASDPASLADGKTYYRSWQVSAVCDLATAQLSFSFGRGNRELLIWAFGQDGSAMADILRGTVQIHENSAYPVTADFRDVWSNARRMAGQATSRIVENNMVKLHLKSPRVTNLFYPAFREFYGALRAGRPVPEGAQAGYEVIDYCERTVRDATMVSE